MHLISTEPQSVNVCKYSFEFESDETVLTEYSDKYTTDSFGEMTYEAGLRVTNVWTGANSMFTVMYLERR